MLHTSERALFFPVWIAATLVMFAAPESATAATVEDSPVEVVRSIAGACAQHEDSRSGLLTLFIQRPTGRTMKLTYSPNDGWRADMALDVTIDVAASSQAGPETQAGRPMTVFIDGPTGFTYFWMPDVGWKFIGQVSNRIE